MNTLVENLNSDLLLEALSATNSGAAKPKSKCMARKTALKLFLLLSVASLLTGAGGGAIMFALTRSWPVSSLGAVPTALDPPSGQEVESLAPTSLPQVLMVAMISIGGACAIWVAESLSRQAWRILRRPINVGKFVGMPKVEFQCDGRIVRLLEDFTYCDAKGRYWTAPSGAVANGASIPPLLWNIFGPPFVGKYRNASIIHDYYCAGQMGISSEVHLMFFEACLTEGLSPRRARLAYAAVRAMGPYWGNESPPAMKRFRQILARLDASSRNEATIASALTLN